MARPLPARPVMALAQGAGAPDRAAAREAQTMEQLLAAAQENERELQPLRPGEVVEGVVASVSGDEALVDLGGRSAGVLSLREASGEGTDVAVGDRVVAAVVQPEGPDAPSCSPPAALEGAGSGRGWPSC
jgi:hypothetical protein